MILKNIWNKYFHVFIYMEYEEVALMDKEDILRILPVDLRNILAAGVKDFNSVQEIRMRTGRPLIIYYDKCEYFLGMNGRLTRNKEHIFIVNTAHIRETTNYISNYSRYAFEEELRQGYITVQGGHRIGVAGKILLENDRIKNMSNISFINIRVAHEVRDCSSMIMPYVRNGDDIYNTLIISPPGRGKTTLLRDMIRVLSDGDNVNRGFTIGVADERSELGACYKGKPQNDLGCRTDVLDGCPKADGMMMLVRSMSPDIIAVDEIGSKEDTRAIDYVMNCGIKVIATVHGMDMDEIRNKPVLGKLVREKSFKRYILLASGDIGAVSAIFDERGSALYSKRGAIPA